MTEPPYLAIGEGVKQDERTNRLTGAVENVSNGIGCLAVFAFAFIVFFVALTAVFARGVFERLDRIEAAIKETK